MNPEFAPSHETVNHIAYEFVRGDVTTNRIESAFSLLKRGVIGQYHKLSGKHLHRYLREFEYRFNRRHDDDVFIQTVRRLCGVKPLRFADLIADPVRSLFRPSAFRLYLGFLLRRGPQHLRENRIELAFVGFHAALASHGLEESQNTLIAPHFGQTISPV